MRCPYCRNRAVDRIYRTKLMRRLPFTQNNQCEKCRLEFMSIRGRLPFRKKAIGWLLFVLLVLTALAVFVGDEIERAVRSVARMVLESAR